MALEVKILTLPNIDNDNERIPEEPEFRKLSLGQVDFIYQYIVPNLLFDMSMVYAIAKSRGVSLTKGDLMAFIAIQQGLVLPNKPIVTG